MVVNFWTFSKRKNSTSRPTGNAAFTFSNVVLKDESGILQPVLEIYQSQAFDSYNLNYAYIDDFHRYYYVSDWVWIVGRWECRLIVDVLATYKIEIGNQTKYVLRSTAEFDNKIVDTLYPSNADITVEENSGSFGWTQSLTGGHYVVGVINTSQHLGSTTTYYDITGTQIRNLMSALLPLDGGFWDQPLAYTADSLLRAIYDPTQYLVSCKWFPCPIDTDNWEYVGFGNYDGTHVWSVASGLIVGNPVTNPINWTAYRQQINLPSTWTTREAKRKIKPNCNITLKCNPWGCIDIDPLDLVDADAVVLLAHPDYISGDCRLEIYAKIGSIERLIAQYNAKISVDIPLSNTSTDVGSLFGSLLGIVGGAASIATGGSSGTVAGAIAVAGNAANAMDSSTPTLTRSGGIMSGIVNIDGIGLLQIRTCGFASQDTSGEFGKPLYKTKTLNTIAGYIQCADSEIYIAAFDEEINQIEEYLTGGFYYD